MESQFIEYNPPCDRSGSQIKETNSDWLPREQDSLNKLRFPLLWSSHVQELGMLTVGCATGQYSISEQKLDTEYDMLN